jgi:ferredoxin
MGYRVRIDPNVCIGTSQCAEVAPAAYQMNDAHTVAVAKHPQAALEHLLEGARSCPVEAITVIDDATGEQLYP